MLTDKDKCDLLRLTSDNIRDAEGNSDRCQLVVNGTKRILLFIINHPDVCAAEIDDFLGQSDDAFFQEIARLRQNGYDL